MDRGLDWWTDRETDWLVDTEKRTDWQTQKGRQTGTYGKYHYPCMLYNNKKWQKMADIFIAIHYGLFLKVHDAPTYESINLSV